MKVENEVIRLGWSLWTLDYYTIFGFGFVFGKRIHEQNTVLAIGWRETLQSKVLNKIEKIVFETT